MTTDYFERAGAQLYQSVFMLAQTSRYPDLTMCCAILALPSLLERIKIAKINPWVRRAFDQFISTSGSEPEAASIVATASGMALRLEHSSALTDISEAELIARYDEAEKILPLPKLVSDYGQIPTCWEKL